MSFAHALLVALALPTGSEPRGAGLEVGDGRPDASPGLARAADSDRSGEKRLACGPNVLYLLLRMHGRPVTFREAEAAVRVRPQGTSLLELRDAAGRLGLSTSVRSCTVNDLDRCTLPMVAHFKPTFGPAGEPTAPPDQSLGDTGHFVVIVEVTKDRVKFIDGTLGRIEVFWRVCFPIFWSGYILEVSPRTPAWGRWLAMSVAVGWACVGLAVYLRGLQVRRAARARPELAVAVAVAVAVAIFVFGGAGSASGGPLEAAGEGIWRQPGYDGVNSLYLQLKSLGLPVRFEAIENKLHPGHDPISLLDLKRAAQDCGARMAIRSCGPRELERSPMPAIVLLEGLRGEREFAVVYKLDGRGCGIVKGSTAYLSEMHIDDFRRSWNGLALVADPTQPLWTKEMAMGFVAIGAYWFFRVRRPAGLRGTAPYSPGTGSRDRPVDEAFAVSQGA